MTSRKKNENLDAENDQINYNVGKPEVEWRIVLLVLFFVAPLSVVLPNYIDNLRPTATLHTHSEG